MRGLIATAHALAAAALLAAGALTACATSGGQGGGETAGLPGAVSQYCEATTPALRTLLRVPLLALLDLPADTGELLCIETDAGMAVVVEGAPAGAEPAAIPPLIVPPALAPDRDTET